MISELEEMVKKYESIIRELGNKYNYLNSAEVVSSNDKNVRKTLIEIRGKLEDVQVDISKIALSIENQEIQNQIIDLLNTYKRMCNESIIMINVGLWAFDLTSTKCISLLVQTSRLGNVLSFLRVFTIVFEKIVTHEKLTYMEK